MTIAVLDIDGVVADLRHRLHYLERPHRDWRSFFAHAATDLVLPEGRALVDDLAAKHDIVWLSGRPEYLRQVTIGWLSSAGMPATELHLRPAMDFRPAALFKVEVLERLRARSIAAVIDDDPRVIDAALAGGFPAVHADWLPRTDALSDAQDKLGRT